MTIQQKQVAEDISATFTNDPLLFLWTVILNNPDGVSDKMMGLGVFNSPRSEEDLFDYFSEYGYQMRAIDIRDALSVHFNEYADNQTKDLPVVLEYQQQVVLGDNDPGPPYQTFTTLFPDAISALVKFFENARPGDPQSPKQILASKSEEIESQAAAAPEEAKKERQRNWNKCIFAGISGLIIIGLILLAIFMTKSKKQ